MGLGQMTKKVLNATTKEVGKLDGGLSTLIFPRHFKKPVAYGIVAGVGLVNVGKQVVGEGNANKLGRVSYAPGPARMTQAYNSGAVQTMMQASQGNYGAFADMAEEVVRGHNNRLTSVIDDYGADSKLISALYNMGGR